MDSRGLYIFFHMYGGNTQRGKATIYTLKKKKREKDQQQQQRPRRRWAVFFFPSLYPDDLDARRLLHRGHTDKRENLMVVVVVVLMGLSESSLQTRTFSTLLNSLPPLNLFLFFYSFFLFFFFFLQICEWKRALLAVHPLNILFQPCDSGASSPSSHIKDADETQWGGYHEGKSKPTPKVLGLERTIKDNHYCATNSSSNNNSSG